MEEERRVFAAAVRQTHSGNHGCGKNSQLAPSGKTTRKHAYRATQACQRSFRGDSLRQQGLEFFEVSQIKWLRFIFVPGHAGVRKKWKKKNNNNSNDSVFRQYAFIKHNRNKNQQKYTKKKFFFLNPVRGPHCMKSLFVNFYILTLLSYLCRLSFLFPFFFLHMCLALVKYYQSWCSLHHTYHSFISSFQ